MLATKWRLCVFKVAKVNRRAVDACGSHVVRSERLRTAHPPVPTPADRQRSWHPTADRTWSSASGSICYTRTDSFISPIFLIYRQFNSFKVQVPPVGLGYLKHWSAPHFPCSTSGRSATVSVSRSASCRVATVRRNALCSPLFFIFSANKSSPFYFKQTSPFHLSLGPPHRVEIWKCF